MRYLKRIGTEEEGLIRSIILDILSMIDSFG